MRSIRAATDRGAPAAFLAVLALALLVAIVIKRAPPDFAALPPLAIVRDAALHKLWAIRLAAAAHQIAVDPITAPPAPEGSGYQLWLVRPDGAHSLGLLPAGDRKVIPEIPALAAALVGRGELLVTLEKARGSDTGQPSGRALFRTTFPIAPSDPN